MGTEEDRRSAEKAWEAAHSWGAQKKLAERRLLQWPGTYGGEPVPLGWTPWSPDGPEVVAIPDQRIAEELTRAAEQPRPPVPYGRYGPTWQQVVNNQHMMQMRVTRALQEALEDMEGLSEVDEVQAGDGGLSPSGMPGSRGGFMGSLTPSRGEYVGMNPLQVPNILLSPQEIIDSIVELRGRGIE